MVEHILEVEHLVKSYDKKHIVLNDISFSLKKGEVVVFVGPSGCGKSTFLRCLNKLEPIDSGEIRLNGEIIARGEETKNKKVHEIRQKIGMVFQSYELFPNMTILENITLSPVIVQKRQKQEVQKEAEGLLKRVGLLEKKDAYPRQLSGGQKQRVAIVRSLIMNPDILLLDEITAALDPEMVREVLQVGLELAKDGMTMAIVTHEMDFARKISNRILFMYDGYIYEEGTPKEIFEHPKKELTKRFIQRLSSLTYKITSSDFDVEAMSDELMGYGEKLLIEAERLSKLMLAFEEICMNNLLVDAENPDILVKVEYSEKLDILTMLICYKGEKFDVHDSASKLFLDLLAEPTTEVRQDDITDDPLGYEHMISMRFRWVEE